MIPHYLANRDPSEEKGITSTALSEQLFHLGSTDPGKELCLTSIAEHVAFVNIGLFAYELLAKLGLPNATIAVQDKTISDRAQQN